MTGFKTAAAMTVLCAALGACADLTPRPQYPVSLPPGPALAPTPAPVAQTAAPAAPTDPDAPRAAPTQSIQQKSLPLPPGAKAAPSPPGTYKRGSALEPRYQDEADVTVFAAAARDDSVTVGKGDTLAKIAKAHGVSVDDLIKANDIPAPYHLKIGQPIKLPGAAAPERVSRSKAAKPEAEPAPSKAQAAKSVTVAHGDTLAKIAKDSGVSIEDLAKANGLQPPYRLHIGQSIALSAAAAPADVAASGSTKGTPRRTELKPEPAAAAPTSVTVGKGDTLRSIAGKAGVSIADLAKLNHLKKPYRLMRGQTLTLPGGDAPEPAPAKEAPKERATATPTSVIARRHETLQAIADKAGVPVAELAKLNHLKKPYRLRAGQTIKLPAEAAAEAPAPKVEPTRPESTREAAPQTVVAGRHDTLQAIADKAGVPVAELAKLNHLRKPYRLRRGQTIKLPGPAPAANYTVKKGDTLYSIARQFGTDPKTLADLNRLDTDARLGVGRRLKLTGGPLDKPAPPPARRAPPPVEAPVPEETPAQAPPSRAPRVVPPVSAPSQPVPYSSLPANPPADSSAPGLAPPTPPQSQVPAIPYSRPAPPASTYKPAPPAESAAPTTSDADVASAGRGFFVWPMRGRILSGYGPKSGGQRNDGLDIAAAAGDPVRAAAGGEVIYAGNSVPGFGNLVLIRHEGGWVTTYAHLANIDVKMRQTVTQGQQIGQAGVTGGVDQPQLHFEVRYTPNLKDRARPIDPMLVLPQ